MQVIAWPAPEVTQLVVEASHAERHTSPLSTYWMDYGRGLARFNGR